MTNYFFVVTLPQWADSNNPWANAHKTEGPFSSEAAAEEVAEKEWQALCSAADEAAETTGNSPFIGEKILVVEMKLEWE